MPIPLFNSIASWFLKKRIHQIELFIKFPHEVQQEVLHGLLDEASQTHYGIQYDFKSIKDYTTFSKRIPLVRYEDIQNEIQLSRKGVQNIFWPGSIKWFAKSSGTTGAQSKFIPVSSASLENCHYKAGKDMLSLYFNNNSESQLLTGKCLRLGGSSDLYHNNSSYFGDLSAIIIDNLPFWAELSSTPSQKTALMPEWEAKMKAILKESMEEKVTCLAGVPSWMLVLLQQALSEAKKNHIHDLWPQAEVYFHGGVSFEPYREQYQQLFPKPNFKYYEIYNASEGFFAIQDQNDSSDLLLMLDYGIFYEFIPQEEWGEKQPKTLALWEVTLDQVYELVITTNGGLWRYRIGDTIRFTSLHPYRIRVSGRTKQFINVFGEELMVENAERALATTAADTRVQILDYTVGPIFMNGHEKGGHEWLIEFASTPCDLDHFAQILDRELQNLNSDYQAKRYKDITLLSPKIQVAPKGLFYQWLESKKKLGGQHKVPRLSNSRKYLDELLAHC